MPNNLILAQCNVETEYYDGKTIIAAEMEQFYESVGPNNNGDYSYGFAIASGRLYRINPNNYHIQISTGFSGIYKRNEVIPRSVEFKFSNGASFTLSAEKYNLIKNGLHVCDFNIESKYVNNFKFGISYLKIIDYRTNRSLNATPTYSRIFSEQLSCIDKY